MRMQVPSASVSLLVILGCAGQRAERMEPLPSTDPRYTAVSQCALAIGVAEGFQLSTISGTQLQRQLRTYESEVLWFGVTTSSDKVRAWAHVQRSRDSRRTTEAHLSTPARRALQRINSECAVPV